MYWKTRAALGNNPPSTLLTFPRSKKTRGHNKPRASPPSVARQKARESYSCSPHIRILYLLPTIHNSTKWAALHKSTRHLDTHPEIQERATDQSSRRHIPPVGRVCSSRRHTESGYTRTHATSSARYTCKLAPGPSTRRVGLLSTPPRENADDVSTAMSLLSIVGVLSYVGVVLTVTLGWGVTVRGDAFRCSRLQRFCERVKQIE